ncbi:HEAT repeat domain-containing protein [Nostoc commune]|uniref:HEAT repeat domain-containing protein n=1 Tax=Nostoc commune TaxID=1178 RepID=UPI0018C4F48F|nr:HEAT repeat domain-containing protein [Nostoc commune]MBG1262925.1 HEAT repeat domain-containing protein [Nostoc commune BAE]
MPAVEILGQTWVHQYYVENDQVRLDEGKGTTTQDRTSNGNLGQIAGAQWSKITEQEIAALVQLLQSKTVDEDTRRQAVESLGKIGTSNCSQVVEYLSRC